MQAGATTIQQQPNKYSSARPGSHNQFGQTFQRPQPHQEHSSGNVDKFQAASDDLNKILANLDQTVKLIKETTKKTQIEMQQNPQQIPSLASMQCLQPLVEYISPLISTI